MFRHILLGILLLTSIEIHSQIDLLNDNIGIGILEPQVPIHMVGDTFKIQNEAGTDLFFMNSEGNIGIGRNPGGHKLDVEGAISARGKFLYLGNSSFSTDGVSKATFRSYHSSITQLIMSDKENQSYGRLYGSGNGRYFGLLDGDGHWAFTSDKDNDIEMRINNVIQYYQSDGVTKLRPSGLTVGWNQTGNRAAGIDFVGDDTYTSYGLRLRRFDGGENALSQLLHRGTGSLIFATQDEADIIMKTEGINRLTVKGSGTNKGNVGIGTGVPNEKLHVNGNIQYAGIIYNTSDRELKRDIKEFEYGIDEVVRLEPVTYNYVESASDNNATRCVGLIAQELDKVAPSLVKPFTLKESSSRNESSKEYLMVNESAIKYMLINAIKEQQRQIDEQQEMIEVLQSEMSNWMVQNEDQNRIEINLKNNQDEQVAYIMQNIPNPTHSKTNIKYFIPDNVEEALVRFYNINGSILKEVILTKSGAGVIELNLEEMISGNYMYSMIVDGQLIDTKKMVIVK